MPLTAPAVSNAAPASKSYRLADGGGMYLEVMPNGSKYWRLKYRFADKEKRLALGIYPKMSLAEARKEQHELPVLLSSSYAVTSKPVPLHGRLSFTCAMASVSF